MFEPTGILFCILVPLSPKITFDCLLLILFDG
jgi:hypothetical protein